MVGRVKEWAWVCGRELKLTLELSAATCHQLTYDHNFCHCYSETHTTSCTGVITFLAQYSCNFIVPQIRPSPRPGAS